MIRTCDTRFRNRKERFRTVRRDIDEYSDHDLDVTTDWVMSDGLPRTSQELFNEVKEALGFQRNGRKIVERIEAAVGRYFERRQRAS